MRVMKHTINLTLDDKNTKSFKNESKNAMLPVVKGTLPGVR